MDKSVTSRKGILLAGGLGSRLYPATRVVSKHLLPVYDKPMVYYALTTLMLSEIREVLIISTPADLAKYQQLLGDGRQWGISLSYCEQRTPRGVAEAFILGEEYLGGSPCALILGDNIFYGHNLHQMLLSASLRGDGATIFSHRVRDPKRYGIVDFDRSYRPVRLVEKPTDPTSNFAVVGLYFYDSQVCEIAKTIKPSSRGELEITDINNFYLSLKSLVVEILGRGYSWLDAGTHDDLLEAGRFIATIERRQGVKIACPEEIAYRFGWITADHLERLAKTMGESSYSDYLMELIT